MYESARKDADPSSLSASRTRSKSSLPARVPCLPRPPCNSKPRWDTTDFRGSRRLSHCTLLELVEYVTGRVASTRATSPTAGRTACSFWVQEYGPVTAWGERGCFEGLKRGSARYWPRHDLARE